MGRVGGVCVNVGVMLTFIMACSDTVTRSGMFCAMATVIDRCKTEGVVDVFQVVKALRAQKPGAVPTVVSHDIVIIIFVLSIYIINIATVAT